MAIIILHNFAFILQMDLTSSVDALVQKEKVFGAIQPLMAMSASGKSSFTDVELYVLFPRITSFV